MISEQPVSPAAAFRNLLLSGRYILPLLALVVALSGFRSAAFSLENLQTGGPPIAHTLLITWFMGAFAGPLMLPWLPGQGLALKGVMAGLLALLMFPATCFLLHLEPLDVVMALLVIPSATSLLMVVFLSPRRSGKTPRPAEMKVSSAIIPVQLALVAMAVGVWIMARFI